MEIKTIIIIIIKKERQDLFGMLLCLEAELLPRLCLIYSLESSTFTSLQTFNSPDMLHREISVEKIIDCRDYATVEDIIFCKLSN